MTKKKVYDIFRPNCSYKTFVVNVNRRAFLALLVLQIIQSMNQSTAHLVKKTNSTDIPVCLNKNAKHLRGIRGQVSLAFSPDSHPKDSPLQLEASCARGEWVSLCIRDGSYIFQIGYNVGGGERTPWINNTSLFDTKTGGHIEIPVLKHCRDNLVVT